MRPRVSLSWLVFLALVTALLGGWQAPLEPLRAAPAACWSTAQDDGEPLALVEVDPTPAPEEDPGALAAALVEAWSVADAPLTAFANWPGTAPLDTGAYHGPTARARAPPTI